MKQKIKRQGLLVTIKELKDLIKELELSDKDIGLYTNFISKTKFDKIPFLVSIINKEGLSDTWRLE